MKVRKTIDIKEAIENFEGYALLYRDMANSNVVEDDLQMRAYFRGTANGFESAIYQLKKLLKENE